MIWLKRLAVLIPLALAGAIPAGTTACGGTDAFPCGRVGQSCSYGCCGNLECGPDRVCQAIPIILPADSTAIRDSVAADSTVPRRP